MALELIEQLDNLYTTTWQLRKKEVIDNVFNATPFFFWLNEGNRLRTEQGGRFIEEPLMYGRNETVKAFGRGDTFDLVDKDHLTVAIYQWRYVGGSIVRYWVDDQKNRGKAQIINLMNSKIENLRLSLIEKLEQFLFGDGSDPLAPHGLQQIVRDTAPTGPGEDVLGNIDSYTYPWWQNKRMTATGPFSTSGIRDMRHMFNTCSKGNDTPDFILTHQDIYEAYEDELLEIHRIVNKKLADAGFENLSFKGRPITWAPLAPEGKMYFLNSKYISWVTDEFANFDMTDWKPVEAGSLDRAAQIVVAGNLTVNNRRMQGVITGIEVA